MLNQYILKDKKIKEKVIEDFQPELVLE